MFLTPEGVPFFGGTYFPPDDRHGRPGFSRVLSALSKAWAEDRDNVIGQSAKYTEGLAQVASHELAGGGVLPSDGALEQAILTLLRRVDRQHGGFGGAPKFPNASALRLLARGARRAQRRGRPAEEVEELRSAFLLALRKMGEGGIYDQSGGGFCRYATDGVWLVPHFEKMLYDNAQLLALYAEGHQISPDPLFAHVIRTTARFLEREMRAPEGALYTALDADSEGVEGRYYVWTWDELAALLPADELSICERLLGCTRQGNWRDPHGHAPPGANVISLAAPPADAEEATRRDAVLEKLFVARQARVRPSTDDKVLASMNGLCILGLSEAGRVLGDRSLIDAAVRTAEFVLGNMRDQKTGRLYRSWQGGRARLPGTLDDHAYVADGLFALYEATFDARWFDAAQKLVDLALDLFWDDKERVFYLTAADEADLPQLIERPISGHDGAVPAGASVLIDRLVTVGHAAGLQRWTDIAEQALSRRGERALEQPFAYAHLLGALDALLEGPTQIVIAGDGAALERAVAEVFLPSRLLVRSQRVPSALASLVTDKTVAQGAAAFVCRGQRCELPERDPSKLRATLAGVG